MSGILILGIAIALLILLMVIGLPMPLAFGGPMLFLLIAYDLNPSMVCQVGYGSLTSYVLLSIPLFTMGGAMMSNSRIGHGIVDWFEAILGRMKACLVPVTACAYALFGAVSGSGMAVMCSLTPILFPRMKEKGYPPETVAAVMCCAAPLGLLIPPSATQILFAWSANCSVLACFLAIVIPGIATTLLLAIVGRLLCLRKNRNLPKAEKQTAPQWVRMFGRTTGRSLPGLAMPIIVLGGIYSGIMTVTEAAAVAAVYALIMGTLVYRDIKAKQFIGFMADASTSTGVVLLNVFVVMVFSRILLQEGLPAYILDFLLSISNKKWVILLMINIFLIILGMIMNDTCGTLLAAMLLTPIIKQCGMSIYQFAAIVGVNLGMGCITPPAAPFLYMSSRLTKVSVNEMMKDVLIILVLVYLPVLAITTYVPDFSLWLPRLILGAKFA